MTGNPIAVSTHPVLAAHRGRLLLQESVRGQAVYAAAFLRERKIILEAGLLSNAQCFQLILIHELFHFVWLRVANTARAEFNDLLLKEWSKRARGELGESSALKKERLREAVVTNGSRHWRDYVCESFCDTAAWLYGGTGDSALFTLGKGWMERRQAWFQSAAKSGGWKC